MTIISLKIILLLKANNIMFQNTLGECTRCRSFIETPLLSNDVLSQSGDISGSVMEENKLSKRITELEIELAQTKLALVESECRNQV